MKTIIKLFFMLLFATKTMSQNIDSHILDSMLAIPQTLELKISSPQPRLNEKVEVSLDINYVRAQIFKTEIGKFEVSGDIGDSNEGLMIMKVVPLFKGKQSMGPLSFNMNGTNYKTTKINYEVIESLPKVDKGLWFRKVITSDSTFCIIIEQRIPANKKVTKVSEKKTKYWTEPLHENIAKFKDSYSIDGLNGGDGTVYSGFDNLIDEKGIRKEFMSGYSISYFRIIDKQKKITITKDNFLNIPVDYTFENIFIQ